MKKDREVRPPNISWMYPAESVVIFGISGEKRLSIQWGILWLMVGKNQIFKHRLASFFILQRRQNHFSFVWRTNLLRQARPLAGVCRFWFGLRWQTGNQGPFKTLSKVPTGGPRLTLHFDPPVLAAFCMCLSFQEGATVTGTLSGWRRGTQLTAALAVTADTCRTETLCFCSPCLGPRRLHRQGSFLVSGCS